MVIYKATPTQPVHFVISPFHYVERFLFRDDVIDIVSQDGVLFSELGSDSSHY